MAVIPVASCAASPVSGQAGAYARMSRHAVAAHHPVGSDVRVAIFPEGE